MFSTRKDIELAVRMPVDKHGTVDMLLELRSHHINVHAYTSYQDHSRLVALLITDDPVQTLNLLQKAGYECKSHEILLVEIEPYNIGLLVQLRSTLERAGVSILSSHLCSTSDTGLRIAVQTTDNALAFLILQYAQHLAKEDQCESNATTANRKNRLDLEPSLVVRMA